MKPVKVDGVTYYPVEAPVPGACRECAGRGTQALCDVLIQEQGCSRVVFKSGEVGMRGYILWRLTK